MSAYGRGVQQRLSRVVTGLIATSAVVWPVTGCGRACNSMGATSGAVVDLSDYLVEEGHELSEVSVCLDERCEGPRSDGLAPGSVSIPLEDGSKLRWTLRVSLRPSGKGLLEKPVELLRDEPNGPGCDPQVTEGTVRVGRTGTVTVTGPS